MKGNFTEIASQDWYLQYFESVVKRGGDNMGPIKAFAKIYE